MNERSSGILLHATSLFNRFPIGDLGPSATDFVDFLVQSGQRWWQMLPIGPAGEEDSPYQSMSAFAGNPLLLSPDRLMEKGYLAARDIEVSHSKDDGKADYPAAARLKLGWLKKAFANFEKKRRGDALSDFEAFVREEDFWLGDFSLFSAIREKEDTSDWSRWDGDLRTRRPDRLLSARKYFADDIRFQQFIQWQFSVQWKELRAFCGSKGIRLMGDVPHFVAHQSADVWAHPELFKLDAGGHPTVVAGVPPDDFSKTGQLWDLPVYRWEALQAQGYRWWIERLRTAFGRFDANRLDHFIGFVRTFEVPSQALTAVQGRYQPGGGASFFQAVREALGLLHLIADDLGVITPEVTALLDRFHIPGTKVLQFEYKSDLENGAFPQKPHPENSVIYTGTHDNDTTAGWYLKLPTAQREALQKQLGTNDRDVVWAMIREALASQSETTLLPAQDLLELTSEARMNFPGVSEGNWRWRLKGGALSRELAQRLRALAESNGRSGSDGMRQALWYSEEDAKLRIEKRAYEIYEGRGRRNGQSDQDWLHAEQELKREAIR